MNGRAAVAARLSGFVLLIAVIFAIAYFVGVRIGPVSLVHGHGGGGGPSGSGGGGGGGMTMSTIFARSAAALGSGAAR
jgi:hypothetical protein